MTFTEAALEVLRREGKPLHFRKIAEIAARENLLDHVGKVPEETMADQLAAHCRLPRIERRLIPVQAGTFALVEWGLDEDPAGLEGLVEPPPENEPPYRGRERHPIPSREMARASGRGEGGRRRREEGGEERRAKRYPPPAEVAYEILAGAGRSLPLADVAAQGVERLLMPDAFLRDRGSLEAALLEDNRRRESSGRKPLFQLDGETVTLVAQPEPGERAAVAAAVRVPAGAAELRRAALAAVRRRLRECDGATVEHLAARLLEKLGYREVKVAKRGREHVVLTARRRLGVADVRHCVRVLRGNGDATRRDVSDLRRDLGHYGAQIGVVVTAGEAHREARGDAVAAAQLPVLLLCGEALAEAFADAGVGCVPVVVPEIDEAFFRAAAETAAQEEAARRARREERDRRDDRDRREPRREVPAAAEGAEPEVAAERAEAAPLPEPAAGDEGPGGTPSVTVSAVAVADDEGGDGDEGEEGDDEEGDEAEDGEGAPREGAAQAAEGAPSTDARSEGGRRRRRRRRRRGGRGRSREGAAPGAPASAAAAPGPTEPGGSAPAPAAAAPAAPPPASAGGDGGSEGGGGGEGAPA